MATDGYHSMIFVDDLNDLPSVNATPENENGTEGASYRHTYDSWHLVPSNRPDIAIPPLRERLLEVPGSDGSLDLTSALTGYPLYGMREGSQEFWVLNDHPESWVTLRDTIIRYLHGKTKYMVLEDDPNYYYEGRWKVNNWKSDKDHSLITLDYTLKPYKLKPNPTIYSINLSNGIERSVTIAQSDYPIVPIIRLAQIGSDTVTKIAYTNKRGETLDFDSEEHPAKILNFGENYLTDMNTYFLNQTVKFLTVSPGIETQDFTNVFNKMALDVEENRIVYNGGLVYSQTAVTYIVPIDSGRAYYLTQITGSFGGFYGECLIKNDIGDIIWSDNLRVWSNNSSFFSPFISPENSAFLYVSAPKTAELNSAMIIRMDGTTTPKDLTEYIAPSGNIAQIAMTIQEGRL